MPQSLLALLAMMVVSLYSFHQQENILRMRASMIRDEIAHNATAVAIERLDEIGTLAFDEGTKGGDIHQASELTVRDQDGRYPQDTPADDLDDFDGVIVPRVRLTSLDTLHYDVRTRVVYVSEVDGNTEVDVATRYKKATATVYLLDTAQPDSIYLSQVYACGSRCDW